MSTKSRIYDLRAETLTNPIGLTEDVPHLTWKLTEGTQTAYRIEAGSTPGHNDLWDTGRVETTALPYVAYGGLPLTSRQRVFWKVTVWGGFGQIQSEDAHFEMGLLSPGEWKANWIQSSLVGGAVTTAPSPLLRKSFAITKPIKHARLYISALGLYVAEINGHKIGDEKLAPGWTDYKKRVSYQTFDVTKTLHQKENVLGATLGDGWYVGHVGWRHRQYYGDRPKLIARLEITHTDGTRTDIVTDDSWKFIAGPILESDCQMGESYDARQEKPGWSTPGFIETNWFPVEVSEGHTPLLIGDYYPPMRVKEEIHPISVEKLAKDRFVYDMGQNMVGHARFTLTGKKGQTIKLRHAEVLLDNKSSGEIYVTNLRTAKATDHYTFAQDGEVTWEPQFTFHGFRYLELSGTETPPDLKAITGVVVSSDLKPTGKFECSEPILNQLWHNIKWGWMGNSLSVPTDCPQRDERLGWTGDAQVFSRTANFLTDAESFYAKYTQDLADSQTGAGHIPPIAPDIEIDLDEGGPAWADAFVIVPWESYHAYGDKRVLQKHYPKLRMWLQAQKTTSQNHIRSYEGYKGFRGFGDWLNTDAGTDLDLIGTAYFARCTGIMAQIATILGYPEDATQYETLYQEIITAYREHFLIPGGGLKKPSQTGCVLSLAYHLAPEEDKTAIGKQLTEDIEKRGWHLSTGFVGTSHLMDVLTELGRLDIAYKLLLQKSWPSWLYSVTKGATTIWERWDGWTEEKGFQDAGMNSFNHYAYGAIGTWLYSTVTGITLNAPAKHLKLAPRPGGPLTHASSSYESIYGQIESGWQIKGSKFEWKVRVPANVVAAVEFPPETSAWHLEGKPCESKLTLEPGNHTFSATWTAKG